MKYSRKWLRLFDNMAHTIADMSKDTTKVGALLIGPDKEVILSTFNGPPIGVSHDDPQRMQRPTKYLYASHAEQNLVAFAARRGLMTNGLTVYCTHNPCSSCTKSLIQAGIHHIMYNASNSFVSDNEEDRKAVQLMCEEAGVHLTEINFDKI